MNTIALRESELSDGTLIKVSLTIEESPADEKMVISVISPEGVSQGIILPNTIEGAFELMQIAYPILRNRLQKSNVLLD